MMKDLTKAIANDWVQNAYYENVEREAAVQRFWSKENSPFRSLFDYLDLDVVVEIAAGHGRHSAQILDRARKVFVTDINESNIEFCKTRFAQFDNVVCLLNNGSDLSAIESGTVSSVFCYDAMVHFEFTDVYSYLQETNRILKPGGRALFHHSNLSRYPGRLYNDNPHWRNFMSADLFSHMASRASLSVIKQLVVDWGYDKESRDLDCITLVEK